MGGWRLVFDSIGGDPAQLSLLPGTRRDGDRIHLGGGQPQVACRLPLRGAVAFEAEVEFLADAPGGDLGLYLGGEERLIGYENMPFSAVQLKAGAPGQPVHKLKDGGRLLAQASAPLLRTGRVHRLRAEHRGGRLRLLVDGHEALSAPLAATTGVVGVNGWDIAARLHRLRVWSGDDAPAEAPPTRSAPSAAAPPPPDDGPAPRGADDF